MKISITYDYELFFGDTTGTAERCILQPTRDLIELAKRTNAKFTFFIDVGYLKKLKEYKSAHPILEKDYQAVSDQIKKLTELGHACELHIHPHWEDSEFENGQWNMVVKRYKLADFEEGDAKKIIEEYYHLLAEITGVKPTCYRAGGWCLQPFRYKDIFEQLGLRIDSTSFRGGSNKKGNYYYDFANLPDKDSWKFANDFCNEDENGNLIEIPIASQKYSSLFFWKLFLLGRLSPDKHKPIGNGFPMASPGLRKEMLTNGKLLCSSVDGYFVTKLDKSIKEYSKRNWERVVFIGHPKANTKFALDKLEKFIHRHQNDHSFVTLPSLINEES